MAPVSNQAFMQPGKLPSSCWGGCHLVCTSPALFPLSVCLSVWFLVSKTAKYLEKLFMDFSEIVRMVKETDDDILVMFRILEELWPLIFLFGRYQLVFFKYFSRLLRHRGCITASVCEQNNSKGYEGNLIKFSGNVDNGSWNRYLNFVDRMDFGDLEGTLT